MIISAQIVAQQLQLIPDTLIQHNLTTFLKQEIQSARVDIADLQTRYGVCSAADLRTKIERGDLSSHPAWEDAIEWEQLETHLWHVQKLLEQNKLSA